nr:TraR/DksA family transcriptional regulator [Azomonas macrocytogenes]
MNAEQQAFFKKLLEEKTRRVQQRLVENQEACRIERQPDDTDFATTEEQRSMALSMIDRDRVELKRINNALEIIESGDYGFCLETGDPIGIKRLLLVPESLYSVETMRIREAKDAHQAKVS